MSECSNIQVYESLQTDRVYNNASMVKEILKEAALTNDLDQDKVMEYLTGLQYQAIIPLVFSMLCFMALIVISIVLCCKCKCRNCKKRWCRNFYLFNILFVLSGIGMSVYFTGSITNSMLDGACQLENSRVEAETLVSNLNSTILNITDNLESFVDKVVNSLGSDPPSTILQQYTESLDALYSYASNTDSCNQVECLPIVTVPSLPPTTRVGTYYCTLCLNSDPINLVSKFLQDEVSPPVEENEKYLDLIDTNFVQAKGSIQDGLDSVSGIQTQLLSKEGSWGEINELIIETTYSANERFWYVSIIFIFIVIALIVSIPTSDAEAYVRLNCLSYLTCSTVILTLVFCAVVLPILTISNDTCSVMNTLPDNIEDYYEGGADTIEVINKCFGDGKLPKKYLDDLNFVDEVGDCPQYNVNDVFEGIPSGSLKVLVDSMGSFTNAEIAGQSDSVYKQRMVDIMKIKELAQVTYDKEELLKDVLGTSIDNVLQICADVEPLFNLVKNKIYGFSCKAVGNIYYSTISSVCVNMLDSFINLTVTLYIFVVACLLYYFGMFGYFVSGRSDGYEKV